MEEGGGGKKREEEGWKEKRGKMGNEEGGGRIGGSGQVGREIRRGVKAWMRQMMSKRAVERGGAEGLGHDVQLSVARVYPRALVPSLECITTINDRVILRGEGGWGDGEGAIIIILFVGMVVEGQTTYKGGVRTGRETQGVRTARGQPHLVSHCYYTTPSPEQEMYSPIPELCATRTSTTIPVLYDTKHALSVPMSICSVSS